jgi:ribonuclease BN (tRNA processing enzyme)
MLDAAVIVHELSKQFTVGPFDVRTWLLPHWRPNAGLRLEAGRETLAYTGDCGPSPDLIPLAASADVFLAESTYPHAVPADSVGYLSSARDAGRAAARAGVGRLVLTHLWPGTSPGIAVEAAAEEFSGEISVAGENR